MFQTFQTNHLFIKVLFDISHLKNQIGASIQTLMKAALCHSMASISLSIYSMWPIINLHPLSPSHATPPSWLSSHYCGQEKYDVAAPIITAYFL